MILNSLLRIIPTLFHPFILGTKNRYFKGDLIKKNIVRDLVLIGFALFFQFGIYRGTMWTFNKTDEYFKLTYLAPTLPLSLILLSLSIMILISGTTSIVGSFYTSDDCDLIRASPFGELKFFIQRILTVFFSTSLIPLLFFVPILLAFKKHFALGWGFFWISESAVATLFFGAILLSYLLASLLVHFIPLQRTKWMWFIFVGLFFYCVTKILALVTLMIQSTQDSEKLFQMVSIFQKGMIEWLPSHWVTEVIDHGISPDPIPLIIKGGLLITLASSLFGIAATVHLTTYNKTSSNIRNHRSGKQYSNDFLQHLLDRLPQSIRTNLLSFWLKDLRLIRRDMSQLFQGVLLLGMYLMYVYNLQIFAGFHTMTGEDKWWERFLFITNFSISAFIATALCTRFVFPSLSLEGKQITALVKSPITLARLIRAKFLMWLFLVSLSHCLTLTCALIISGSSGEIIAINVAWNLMMSFGLVSLAMGLGAIFHRFDWESSSQLAAGFGNLVFMFVASGYIFINIPALWVTLLLLEQHSPLGFVIIALLFGAMVWFNKLLSETILQRGEAALSKITQ